MKGTGIQIRLNSKWTKRLALALSILYLSNPLYVPLNFVLHELLEVFESPNKVIGYETNFTESQSNLETAHSHETMRLGSAHKIIDLLGEVLESSKTHESPHQKTLEKVKIDKHISSFGIEIGPSHPTESADNFRPLSKKLKKGHLIKCKEPPQLS